MTPISAFIQKPFPESLDDRVEAILSSANTEVKDTTLLLGLAPYFQTCTDMRNNIAKSINSSAWIPTESVFGKYCTATLVPIGLVAEERVTQDLDSRSGCKCSWRLTEAGEEYGQPIAAFSMRWALNNNMSIYNILGQVNSGGQSRAVSNRIRLLEALNKTDALRRIDLSNILDLEKGNILEHLRALKRIRFVDYDSIGNFDDSHGAIKYTLASENIPTIRIKVGGGDSGFVSEQTVSDILDILKKTEAPLNKYEINERLSTKFTIAYIGQVLNELANSKYIEISRWGSRKYSEARILNPGQNFIEGYIKPIKRALQGDEKTLEGMRRIRDSLSSNDYSAALNLYAGISPNVNQRSSGERLFEIQKIIGINPGITVRSIEMKINLSDGGVRRYLPQLERQGKIVKNRDRLPYRYYRSNTEA